MAKPSVDRYRTVKATRTTEAWPEDGYTEPGQVFIDTAGTYANTLLFACPGCGRMGGITVGTEKPDPPGWKVVKGDKLEPETLTLSPSINCVGCCKWHGHLTAGVFKCCETPPAPEPPKPQPKKGKR